MAFRKLLILPKASNKNIAYSAYRMTNYFKNTVNGVYECNTHEILYNHKNDSDYHKDVYDKIINYNNINKNYKYLCFGGDQSISIGSTLASINKDTEINTGVLWIDSKKNINDSNILSDRSLSYILGKESFDWTSNINHLNINDLYYWGLKEKNKNTIQNIDDIAYFLSKYNNFHISIDINSIDIYDDESYDNNNPYAINVNDLAFFIRRLGYIKDKKYSIDLTEYIPDNKTNFNNYIFKWNMLKYIMSSINTN